MEKEYHILNARQAADGSGHCLLILHNKNNNHINLHVSLKRLNEIVDALNKGNEEA